MQPLQLRVERVAHELARTLFSHASFALGPGFVGLVGENGAGKSTLLRILARELPPTSGRVVVSPQGLVTRLVRQEVTAVEPAMQALAARASRDAMRLGAAFALHPAELRRFPTLSPGERKRWQLAAALSDEPDVLLLDEPTNHLDASALELLAIELGRFRGIGVVVSHDRGFLDRLTRSTLRVHRETVTLTPLPYTAAKELWDRDLASARTAREVERSRVAKAKAALDHARRAHAGAHAETSARRRMKDRNDSDARSVSAQMRADSAESTLGRRAARLRAAVAHRVTALGDAEVDTPLGRAVFVERREAGHPHLVTRDRGPFEVFGRTLELPALALRRDDKVWLTGRNGAGKSTLLRGLFGDAALHAAPGATCDRGMLVVPQDLRDDDGLRALAHLGEMPPDERGRAFSLLAALGVEPSHVTGRAREGIPPSPGETRKLWLALALTRPASLVVLDEPTNHLDLPSIERLEAALVAFRGALVLVSHDVILAARTTRARWHVDETRLVVS